MEKLKAWIVLLILPVLGIVVPELGTSQEIVVLLGSFAGVAGVVVIITQALKKELNYQAGVSWKYLPQTITVITSILLASLSWWLGFGVFAQAETIIHTIGLGLLVSGVSNGWYDVPFVYHWAQLLFKISPKKKA